MKDQIIISISREYGSGGHVIAEEIAGRFDLPFYDSNLLIEMAKEKNMDISRITKYDEMPKNKLFSRRVQGYSNSPEEIIANLQFEYLKEKADRGDSFVIVGRCSEYVLRDNKNTISIFILADLNTKIERVCQIEGVSPREAEFLIKLENRKRKSYHNLHCDTKWGDSRNYELSVNASKLGKEKTVDLIENYIKERISTK